MWPKERVAQELDEENCEIELATVHCAKCEVVLCSACDADEHSSKLRQTHQRTPLGGDGSAESHASARMTPKWRN